MFGLRRILRLLESRVELCLKNRIPYYLRCNRFLICIRYKVVLRCHVQNATVKVKQLESARLNVEFRALLQSFFDSSSGVFADQVKTVAGRYVQVDA